MPPGPEPHLTLVLTDAEREEPLRHCGRRRCTQRLALRVRIVPACADGTPVSRVAPEQKVSNNTAVKWRRRFVERREGLPDEPWPGAPHTVSDGSSATGRS